MRLVESFSFALFLLLSPVLTPSVQALTSVVWLTEGGSLELRQSLSRGLTEVMNCLESQDFTLAQDCFTPEGLASFRELVERTGCLNVNPLYETPLLTLETGGFEVRELKVRIDMRDTPGNPYQQLTFSLTPAGKICEARFGLEEHLCREVVRAGERIQDLAAKQQLLQFLEIFRTAYNRKDLSFLQKVYSNDALIIVGRVLKEHPDLPDLLATSKLNPQQIKLIKMSKREYLERLGNVFALNETIKVNFSEIEVYNHPHLERVYGVTLKQDWHSVHYSDEGFLFLMVDYRDLSQPLIHVRSWQDKRFPDGSVVDLGCFDLVE